MGVTGTTGDAGRPNGTGNASPRPAGVVASTGAPLPLGLPGVLGSEDSLFRDPFADFAPSGR
jgi:hypothetical protein